MKKSIKLNASSKVFKLKQQKLRALSWNVSAKITAQFRFLVAKQFRVIRPNIVGEILPV